MSCCERCDRVYRRIFRVSGDGDGIEFLDEIDLLVDGGRATSTVVLSANRSADPH